MADQILKVWAKEIVPDPVKGNAQRRPIRDEEWLQGWGRLHGASNQQLNTLFNLLTHHAAPSDICAYPFPDTVTITEEDAILEMNGQLITEIDQPVLYATYGANLPDMASDNLTGFVWVVRNH